MLPERLQQIRTLRGIQLREAVALKREPHDLAVARQQWRKDFHFAIQALQERIAAARAEAHAQHDIARDGILIAVADCSAQARLTGFGSHLAHVRTCIAAG
jgi:phosphoribosylformimino-5-aminoimidazole carboxamide ribonucleotide (ProFAR) isomerase